MNLTEFLNTVYQIIPAICLIIDFIIVVGGIYLVLADSYLDLHDGPFKWTTKIFLWPAMVLRGKYNSISPYKDPFDLESFGASNTDQSRTPYDREDYGLRVQVGQDRDSQIQKALEGMIKLNRIILEERSRTSLCKTPPKCSNIDTKN